MTLKEELKLKCTELINDKISIIKSAINAAQTSANEETKSSAGDKYETGRAMAQLEIEKLTVQLNENKKLIQQLDLLNLQEINTKIRIGSLIYTDQGNYFLSISIGNIVVGNQSFILLSPSSPIGKLFLGKSKGEVIEFNGKKIVIKDIE